MERGVVKFVNAHFGIFGNGNGIEGEGLRGKTEVQICKGSDRSSGFLRGYVNNMIFLNAMSESFFVA